MSVFWNTEQRKARKEHVCSDCRRTIRVGETYRHGVGFEGGKLYSEWNDCRHCLFVLHGYDLAWDGEYSPDSFHEWATSGEYQDLGELRMQAGFRKGWTTAQGNLWPLPVHTDGSGDA